MKMPISSWNERLLYTVKEWAKLSFRVMCTGSFFRSHVPAKVSRIAAANMTAKITATTRYCPAFVLSLMSSVGTRPARIAPREEKIIRVPENRARTV